MVNYIKLLDKINFQKYIYLIDVFLSNEITVSCFLQHFLQTRREDNYWLTSSFDDEVNSIMDSIFLDIDEYNPEELYDPSDGFNINEEELRIRLDNKVSLLKKLI
ncbi:colicin immunity domain-containing protein [Sphingobacterium kitahiroshimense]|uniref:Colicin immunity domain-containing protein n=1 Tax=Sphingobacterium kitahiroshimense TaxID=470446 RepID=A0ABV0BTK0_9SPHI